MVKKFAFLLVLLCCLLHAAAFADGLPAEIPARIAEDGLGELVQAVETCGSYAVLTRLDSGAYRVHMFLDFGDAYNLDEQSPELPALNGTAPSLEASSDGFILRYDGQAAYRFRGTPGYGWALCRVEASDPTQSYACNAWLLLSYDGASAVYVHDSTAYLRRFHPADFPPSFLDAAALKDSYDCAFVNNTDPGDRLHLRAAPSRDAISKGRFYNATPVKILEISGEWAHVQLDKHNDGYMLAEYLAIGTEAMLRVPYLRPAFTLRAEALAAGVTVYSRPDASTVVRGTVYASPADPDRVAGYINSGWLYVQFDSGRDGYVMSDAYEE